MLKISVQKNYLSACLKKNKARRHTQNLYENCFAGNNTYDGHSFAGLPNGIRDSILVPDIYSIFFLVGLHYPVMPTEKKHRRFRKYVTLFLPLLSLPPQARGLARKF